MRRKFHEQESSNYFEITIYDKDDEIAYKRRNNKRADKGDKPISDDTSDNISDNTSEYIKFDISRFKNVIRTEVKLKNGRLNSNKSQDIKNCKSIIRTKDLDKYYSDEALTKYYSNAIKKIFGIEPFYRIDIAIEIINSNVELKPKMKKKLCDLLYVINSEGYSKAERIWKEKYSSNTFALHIKKIRSLGINVLTFPQVIDGIVIPYEMVPNFTMLENSIFKE